MKKAFGYSLLFVALLSVGLIWLRRPDTSVPVEQIASGDTPAESGSPKGDQHKAAEDPETVAARNSSPTPTSAKSDINPQRQFGLSDTPSGKLHEQLARLNPTALKRALKKLSDPHIPHNDFASLRVVSDGSLFYACDIPPGLTESSHPTISTAQNTSVPVDPDTVEIPAAASATPPVRHSRQGSSKVIYLDFQGPTISGTVWNTDYNGGIDNPFTTLPYSTDGHYGSFSDSEQATIIRVWERVAEDFRPFDVDVTTEAPASMGPNVAHVVITRSTRADDATNPEAGDSGGVAFLNNFGSDYTSAAYSPAFVYHDHTGGENGMAVAISHEVGHYIGELHHDGTSSIEYYSGHGSGDTSWGSIMGAPYGKNVTQWSKGEYYNANNTEDDLALLAAKLGYISDDFGDSNGTAGTLSVNGNTFTANGVIGTTNDADRFAFTVGAGDLIFNVNPFRSATAPNGGNSDLFLQLLDSSGNVIASANPTGETGAGIVATIAAGTYYVRVFPVGLGSPFNNPPSGYTVYGSLGAYSLSGSFTGSVPQVAPSITGHPTSQTVTAGQNTQFSASASGNPSPSYQWQFKAPGGAWTNISEAAPWSGTNTSTLIITGVPLGYDGYEFRCQANNSLGTAYTNAATIRVTAPITFTGRPLSQQVLIGSSFTASVSTTDPNATYIWKHNGLALAGVSGTTLSIGAATKNDAGFYEVVAMGSAGTASTYFQLHVSEPNLGAIGWGTNTYGESLSPPGLYGVVDIAGGVRNSLALTSGGNVVAWSSNGYPESRVPSGLNDVVAIAIGGNTSMALKADGTVSVWGTNTDGQNTIPANLTEVIDIAAGESHCLALKADGTVVAWGDSSWGKTNIPSNLTGVVAISAGIDHSIALMANGTVTVWGNNFNYSSVTPPPGLNDVVSIASGSHHILALQRNGTVVAWGFNASGQTTIPSEASPAVAIAANRSISMALSPTGQVTLWGQNSTGILDIPEDIREVYKIAAGATHALAIVAPRTIAINGQPSSQTVNFSETITLSVSATGIPSPSYQWMKNGEALADGGRISGTTGDTLRITNAQKSDEGAYTVAASNVLGSEVSKTANITVRLAPQFIHRPLSQLVSSGQSTSLDATVGGEATYQWTLNDRLLSETGGRLDFENISPDDAGVYQVTVTNEAGRSKTLFYLRVARPNVIRAWGANEDGQSTVPSGLADVADISAGISHALAVRADGTVAAWGLNDDGQVTVPSGLNNVVQVSAGAYHSVALKADGTVVAWGNNDHGQCDIPTDLTGVVFVSAGGSHTVALKGDGTMVAWGDNTYGQSTVPANARFARYVSAGMAHNVALTEGYSTAWGRNNYGQTSGSNIFTAAQAAADYTVYFKSSFYYKSVGEVRYIGHSTSIPTITNATAISIREFHGLALRETGGVVAWGSNTSGENNVPIGLGNVQQVAAGGAFSIVLVSPETPVIFTQPISQTVAAGNSATLRVTAGAVISYQWQRNGVDLTDNAHFSGTNTATLTISDVQTPEAGDYVVILSNGFGDTISETAAVTVRPLLISNLSSAETNADGSQVTLSVTMSTPGPFTYQWYTGVSGDTSTPLDGEQNSSLIVSQGTGLDNYWVRVSNGTTTVDSASIPLGKWRRIDPLFGTSELSATAYGAGKYVVVGEAVGYSTNGIEWKVGNIEDGADLRSVMYDGTRFIAGGVRGQIFSSLDGVNWIKLRAADIGKYTTDLLSSIASANGATVFVGASQKLMSSADGSNWDWRPTSFNGDSTIMRSVAFGSGKFVAAGGTYSSGPQIMYSSDGINWTPCTYSTKPFTDYYQLDQLSQIFYINGNFIALGRLANGGTNAYYMTSVDGISWSTPAFTNAQVDTERMTQGTGLLLSGNFRSSSDGINWTTPHAKPPRHLSNLGFGNGLFIALESTYGNGYASISTSSDLDQWITRSGFGIPEYISYAHDRFFGNTHESSGYSMDGTNWIAVSVNAGQWRGDVTYGNGLYVCRSTSKPGGTLYTSSDGITWTRQDLNDNGDPLNFGNIDYLGGRWIASSRNAVFTSSDALSWSMQKVATFTLADMAYGNGRYVGVGYSENSITSEDGVVWVESSSGLVGNQRAIVYGDGIFVAISSYGVATSSDGEQWIQRQLPTKDGASYVGYISALSYGGGRFVINYGDDLLSSEDGINWQITPKALSAQVGGNYFTGQILYARGNFWAYESSFPDTASWFRAPIGPSVTEITATPPDVVVANGESTTLAVTATGVSLSYQWYQGATGDVFHLIEGATSASFSTPNLSETSQFWVRISGLSGSADSATITVRIAVAPTISVQPEDINLPAGENAILTVVITGTPSPTFQWYEGESGVTTQPIPSAVGSSYTVPNPTTAARYWVRVTNSVGSIDSIAANVAPWFERSDIMNKQLAGVAYGAGRWVVSGFGSNDFYSDDGQTWHTTANRFGGQSGGEIAHGHGVFIAIDSDNTGTLWKSTDGNYWQKIVIPGANTHYGSVTYTGGLLFALGANGEFATSSDGSNWVVRFIGSDIIPNDVAYGNGIFVIANGNKVYRSADLAIWDEAPVLDTETRITSLIFAQGQFVGVGGANQGKIMTSTDGSTWSQSYVYSTNGVYDIAYDGIQFAVSASDHIILSSDAVHWQLAPFSNTSQIASGNHSFLAVGGFGAWQSAEDTRPVLAVPTITTQPTDQAVLTGTPVILSVAANSPVSVAYQWQKNGVDIHDATSMTYEIASVQSSDEASYTVVVTNSAGSVTSDTATIMIALPPTVSTGPTSQTVYTGTSTTFTVTATSNASVTYQWLKDGNPITSATSSTYVIASTQPSDAGDYTVTITNLAGSATSTATKLTVNPASLPVITQQPTSATIFLGQTIPFTVTATGDPAPTYRWQIKPVGFTQWGYFSDSDWFHDTSTATFTINPSKSFMNGDQYRVIVTNVAGQVISDAASLEVRAAAATMSSSGAYAYSLFQRADGTLWAAGDNGHGEFANGTVTSSATPVATNIGVFRAHAGVFHALLLKTDLSLWSVGANDHGELGVGDKTNRSQPQPVATGVVDFHTSVYHSLFIKSDGSLWGMGWNNDGQLGNGTTIDQTNPVPIDTEVAAVSAGFDDTIYVKTDGTAWATGNNDHGQFSNGTTTGSTQPIQVATGISAVATGYDHTLFLKQDGTLWASGSNAQGQLGDGTNTDRTSMVKIADDVVRITASFNYSLFLKADGSLWGMGEQSTGGQLGTGDHTNVTTPTQIATNVISMSAGFYHVLFSKTDGTFWTLGRNAQGQLGDGTGIDRLAPVLISTGAYLPTTAPTILTATQSDAATTVRLTWTPTPQDDHYEIWRGATNDPNSAAQIATVQAPAYEDTTGTSGVTYTYWIQAVNPIGSSRSDPIAGRYGMAVVVAPVITTQPQAQSVTLGDPVTLTVTATGTAPLTYQWSKDDALISGATSATYTITNVTLSDAGDYDVVVTNSAGNATSDKATLSVGLSSATVTLGDLSATYDGNPHAASATTNPSGLTVNFTYNGSATAPTDAGDYTVVGTIAQAGYAGSATDTLNIAQASQTITFATLADRGFTTSAITLSATADSGLPVSFSVVSDSATISGNQLTLTGSGMITVRASQAGNANTLAATPVDRSFEVTSSAQSWLSGHFTTAELADPAISGLTVDPDGDGLTNLLEYALGLDPKSTDTTGLPEMSTTATDWVYTYTRPVDREDITYEVEMSTDLSSWTTTDVTHVKVSTSGGAETWHATVPLSSAANAFFRLKITQ